MPTKQLSLETETNGVHESEHEQNDNWEWSDSFTEFINDRITGRSLKVCPGLRPICDVNLDIKHLADVADSENAAFSVEPITDDTHRLQDLQSTVEDEGGEDIIYGEVTADDPRDADLYNGYACYGDMFDLPFADNSFETVVADPPWLNLSAEDRRAIFEEIVRVTKPTGTILYNATWVPENEFTRQFDLRFRQQKDFWGGPSFAAFYRRNARDIPELFETHGYESVERYPVDSPFWSEAYPPEALSTDHNTDPKKVSGDGEYQAYCCPMCGCSQLGHLRGEFFETDTGEYNTYQCHNCEFRVDEAVVERLAEELQAKADSQGIPVTEVKSIDYTPACVDRRLEELEAGHEPVEEVLSPDMPWVPRNRYAAATGDVDIDAPSDMSDQEFYAVLDLIGEIPSVARRTGGDASALPTGELERRVKTVSRAVRETSVDHVRNTIQSTLKTSSQDPTSTGETAPPVIEVQTVTGDFDIFIDTPDPETTVSA